MNPAKYFVAGALSAAVIMAIPKVFGQLQFAIHAGHTSPHSAGEVRVHTHEEFAFTANGSIERVAPLFGADKERGWAVGWDPQFLFPSPGTDKEGMVFTVDHHRGRAVWVNSELDLKNGRVQYVAVVPDAMATRITLRLTPARDQTRIAVTYERTALSAEADDHARQMAEADRAAGPDWEKAVNNYLEKTKR